MVISISIPLKPSDEAIVSFLMKLVFGSKRNQNGIANRRECMKHDVFAASKLIEWILKSDKKNRKSFTVVCNLVYGNTIVLSTQVARLLLDAIRAREVVSFHTFDAFEEERKRKTKEQIEKALRSSEETPKKKRKPKEAEDIDYQFDSPALTALKQNITMADVFYRNNENDLIPEDDLAPMDETQLRMLYGILDEPDQWSTPVEKTFVDKQSSNETLCQVREIDLAFDERDIQKSHQTPRNEFLEEIFEPSPLLKDILLYGRLPILSEGEQRKSIEQEMEEARNQGINDVQLDSQQLMEVPRIVSEQLDLENDIFIPKTPRTPRSTAKNPVRQEEADGINFKVPLKEMRRLMEDFSSLVHCNTEPLRRKPRNEMTLKQLLNPIPLMLRQKCNKDLSNVFLSKPRKFDDDLGNNVSSSEDEDEDEEEEPSAKRQRHGFEDLEPIDLSQMKIMATPLKERPISPLHCPEEVELKEELEVPRRFEEDIEDDLIPIPPRTPITEETILEDVRQPPLHSPIDGNRGGEKPLEAFRSLILQEAAKSSPFSFQFDSLLRPDSSRREASRLFYVTLELLKEQEISAVQKKPFSVIEVRMVSHNSDDLETFLN